MPIGIGVGLGTSFGENVSAFGSGSEAGKLLDKLISEKSGMAINPASNEILIRDDVTKENSLLEYLHSINSPITYTSPSPKLVLHSDGELKYAKHNLIARSENFEDWGLSAAGTGITPVVSNNSAEAPNGTMTAGTVTLDLDGGTTSGDSSALAASGITLSGGFMFRLKIWLKGTAGQKVLIRHAGGGSYDTHTFTGGWDEFEGDETAGSTGVKTPLITLRGGFGVNGQGPVTFNIWHPHMFYRPADETYIKTLDNSAVGRYAPAILHDDSGTCLGILAESAVTELCLETADVQDGSNWTDFLGTVTASDSIFGDGYTAYKCTGDGVGSRSYYQTVTLSTSTQYILWTIIEEDDALEALFGFRDNDGADWNGGITWTWATSAIATAYPTPDDSGYVELGTGPNGGRCVLLWFACTSDATNTSHAPRLYPNGTDAVTTSTYVHGTGIYAASKPSSPIITHGATATRAVDQPSIAVADLPFDQTEGTLYAKVYYPNGSDINTFKQVAAVVYEDGDNRIILYNGGGTSTGYIFIEESNTTQASIAVGGGPHAPKTSTKMAASWGEDDVNITVDGTDGTPDTSATIPDNIAILYLGGQGTSLPLEGCITELVYLPRKVSLADLGVLAP